MDRLTAPDIVAGVRINDLKIDVEPERAFNRLGDYEDTGLTPEEIKQVLAELQGYENAKQEKRLIISPREVGDVVYVNSQTLAEKYHSYYGYTECEVICFKRTRTQTLIKLAPLAARAMNTRYSDWHPLSVFGKTVFLTREEAEEALRRMNSES